MDLRDLGLVPKDPYDAEIGPPPENPGFEGERPSPCPGKSPSGWGDTALELTGLPLFRSDPSLVAWSGEVPGRDVTSAQEKPPT